MAELITQDVSNSESQPSEGVSEGVSSSGEVESSASPFGSMDDSFSPPEGDTLAEQTQDGAAMEEGAIPEAEDKKEEAQQEPSTVETLLAGKFKSQEDLVKAYEEAQRKITQEAQARAEYQKQVEEWNDYARKYTQQQQQVQAEQQGQGEPQLSPYYEQWPQEYQEAYRQRWEEAYADNPAAAVFDLTVNGAKIFDQHLNRHINSENFKQYIAQVAIEQQNQYNQQYNQQVQSMKGQENHFFENHKHLEEHRDGIRPIVSKMIQDGIYQALASKGIDPWDLAGNYYLGNKHPELTQSLLQQYDKKVESQRNKPQEGFQLPGGQSAPKTSGSSSSPDPFGYKRWVEKGI